MHGRPIFALRKIFLSLSRAVWLEWWTSRADSEPEQKRKPSARAFQVDQGARGDLWRLLTFFARRDVSHQGSYRLKNLDASEVIVSLYYYLVAGPKLETHVNSAITSDQFDSSLIRRACRH
jgi:hypothetical protein